MGGKSPKPYQPPKPPTPVVADEARLPPGAGAPTPGDIAAARDEEEERRRKRDQGIGGSRQTRTRQDPAGMVGEGNIGSSAILTG